MIQISIWSSISYRGKQSKDKQSIPSVGRRERERERELQLSPAAISGVWYALSFVHEYGTGILSMPEVSDTSRERPNTW